MMINAAIVDDEKMAVDLLTAGLQKFSREYSKNNNKSFDNEPQSIDFKVSKFDNGVLFLTNYAPNYDVVFLDIAMPDLDGMSVAEKLRKIDASVMVIFVTNMANFAIKGYKVNAFDFIVKPLVYEHLRQVINRMVPVISKQQVNPKLTIYTETGLLQINIKEIKYIEVVNHTLFFHLTNKTISSYGTLASIADTVMPYGFVSCNRCYLANMNYINSIDKLTMDVGGDVIQISRPKRKKLLQTITAFIGE